MELTPLEASRARVIEAVAARIARRAASVFAQAGSETCHRYAELGFTALEHDLRVGKRERVREVVYTLVDELAGNGLAFSNLRDYALSLRREVRAALAAADEVDVDLRVGVEEWFFELLMVCTMRFMAWRDEVWAKQSAAEAVERLESQLAELTVALEEKTKLADIIRKSSTPIVPVVRGILVVPLVGTFDSYRAEMLTERLLEEIARSHARAVILDISGVPLFDTAAAQMIIRLGRTVRLLGTNAFVVGMSPATARTIVGLGVDLDGIESHATLQDGLARALLLQKMKITRG